MAISVVVDSSGAVPVATIQAEGVRGANPDVDAIAVRSDHEISVLIWNYHDDDVPGPEAKVQLQISGLPASAKRATLRHYRLDETHSNAWTSWKNMGSPQQPTPEQYKILESAGQLQELKPAATVTIAAPMNLDLQLPRQAVSLVQLSW